MSIQIVSWNVNGLRSIMRKGIELPKADIICLQETRCPPDVIDKITGYKFKKCNSHERPGYAGVAILSHLQPLKEIDVPVQMKGRAICLDFGGFVLLNLYVPNSKPGLVGQEMRTKVWEPTVREFILKFVKKPIIVVGDFNVAPSNDLDIYMPKPATMHGASIIERDDFATLLKTCNLVDTYRELWPHKKEWTWYSNFGKAREFGNGWRIDMVLISRSHIHKVVKSEIFGDVLGSDHRPISILLKK